MPTPHDFTAIYLPLRAEGEEDPSRGGFSTEEAAWAYVFEGMCRRCLAERELALAGDTEKASLFPACACEWAVWPTWELEHDIEAARTRFLKVLQPHVGKLLDAELCATIVAELHAVQVDQALRRPDDPMEIRHESD